MRQSHQQQTQTAYRPPGACTWLLVAGVILLFPVVMAFRMPRYFPPADWWLPLMAALATTGTVAVAAGTASYLRTRSGQTVMARLGPRGLTLCRGLRRPERFAWDELHGVTWTDEWAVVATSRGDRLIPSALRGWRGIAAEIEARLAPVEEGAPLPAVNLEEVRRWLGLLRLECPGVHWSYPWMFAGVEWLMLLLMSLARGGVRGMPFLDWFAEQLVFAAVAPVIVGVLTWAAAATNRIVAKPDGLEHRASGRVIRACGWDECLSVEQRGWYWQIETLRGSFWLPRSSPASAEIAEIVRKVLARREALGAPPRLTAVSDAALSRAETTALAERGLSVSEGTERTRPPEGGTTNGLQGRP